MPSNPVLIPKFHYMMAKGKIVETSKQRTVSTGSPSSLGIVNMTLRDSVIIRVCMGNISIVRNSSK